MGLEGEEGKGVTSAEAGEEGGRSPLAARFQKGTLAFSQGAIAQSIPTVRIRPASGATGIFSNSVYPSVVTSKFQVPVVVRFRVGSSRSFFFFTSSAWISFLAASMILLQRDLGLPSSSNRARRTSSS